ncbi:MAG: bile acid:sodium symporter family protein [Bacteriovoracaceae bacterium]|nr:bile acid:sodium symporter family protein [Bacteriovoracaceae bacterium]
MIGIDQAELNFNQETVMYINYAIGLMMYGVAMDIDYKDFKKVFSVPKAPLIGLFCQFLFLPAIAAFIIFLIKPEPSIGLGLLLVSCCPGGNFSNFLTNYSKGNTALSVSMSTVSTLAASVLLPLNFSFWGSVNSTTAILLKEVSLDFFAIMQTILTILILPTVLGMLTSHYFPTLTNKIKKGFLYGTFALISSLIFGALGANMKHFFTYFSSFFFIVLLTNTAALVLGYGMGKLSGLSRRDRKAITFEIGIQNAAFGLVIVFNFFNGLGGMAIICAWWGVWHLVSGSLLSKYWSLRTSKEDILVMEQQPQS